MANRDSYTLAQQSVIGSMLIDDRCVPFVITKLTEDDFLDPTCRNFFRAIRELAREGRPIDPVTVTGKLKAEGDYVQWCAEVMLITPTAANVDAYIPDVLDGAMIRRFWELCNQGLACVDTEDAAELVRKMSSNQSATARMPRMTGPELMLDFHERMSSKEKPKYLPWGIPTADRHTYAELGDMILLGGYASSGKTLLSLLMAMAQAKAGYKVGYYSLECRGIYLCNNDGTYKFRDITAEDMVRTVCNDRGIPIAELAATGVKLRRKFTATALDKIVTTAYSLAAEQTKERYAVRMTSNGLLVKIKNQSQSSLILRPRSNLIRASTVQSIEKMTNSVGIYDEQGNQLRVLNNQEAIDLYGTMQRHITQKNGENAAAEAQALLDDGGVSETVTVEVLGDSTLVTGETVIVQEDNTGLSGLFWIKADSHTWQRSQYTARLTLNCRNVMNQTTAGSDLS